MTFWTNCSELPGRKAKFNRGQLPFGANILYSFLTSQDFDTELVFNTQNTHDLVIDLFTCNNAFLIVFLILPPHF